MLSGSVPELKRALVLFSGRGAIYKSEPPQLPFTFSPSFLLFLADFLQLLPVIFFQSQ